MTRSICDIHHLSLYNPRYESSLPLKYIATFLPDLLHIPLLNKISQIKTGRGAQFLQRFFDHHILPEIIIRPNRKKQTSSYTWFTSSSGDTSKMKCTHAKISTGCEIAWHKRWLAWPVSKMRCKLVRPPLTDKSVQLIQIPEFLIINNAFQRAENFAVETKEPCLWSRKTGKQQSRLSEKEASTWSTIEEGPMAKVKVNKWFLLTSLCCRLAVLCLKPCFMVSWRRLYWTAWLWVRQSVGVVSLHVQRWSDLERK